jgi:hypothetical protein
MSVMFLDPLGATNRLGILAPVESWTKSFRGAETAWAKSGEGSWNSTVSGFVSAIAAREAAAL